jgi:hypothetical protein
MLDLIGIVFVIALKLIGIVFMITKQKKIMVYK